MTDSNTSPIDPALLLMEKMVSVRGTGDTVIDKLSVDDRVLARVTDGIYRRPSAAFRELVFNAYDADATRVVINTDAPRFDRVSILDNGAGMTEHAVANLIKHIGGSSKRTYAGIDLGTVSPDNPDNSPAGRPLIGKIGIGLFAVVHLTTYFRIITKRKGDGFRLVIDVRMQTHSEERLRTQPKGTGGKERFDTGDVELRYVPASDIDTQGTEVILMELRRATKDILRDADRWKLIIDAESDNTVLRRPERPLYHMGYCGDGDAGQYIVEPQVPWQEGADPSERFAQLCARVIDSKDTSSQSPDLKEIFDQYLEMIWRLSLAAPLKYLDENPFELGSDSELDFFKLSNKKPGGVTWVSLPAGRTLADEFGLQSMRQDPCGDFSVVIDCVELRRPVRLQSELLGDKRRVRAKKPMLFIGQCASPLGTVSSDRGGGPLEFEAYFYWNNLIVPKQNRGVLIRVHGASGVLYDETFMDYKVSELNRLRQLTAEVFILSGMDPALNIDRESFNISHPHYQYLTIWVHRAVLQITNYLKDIGKRGLDREKAERKKQAENDLDRHVNTVWEIRGDTMEGSPTVLLIAKGERQQEIQLRSDGNMVFQLDRDKLKAVKATDANTGIPSPGEQAKAIMSVLAAYRLLNDIPYATQQAIFNDIAEILLIGRRG
ncbi:ATP-binding protein [uncultured Thiodictyon sp.]|uniref:ATP-binding protein n=1 Tax=uncultured Thiodictyon sp. TaxID=1846217 RepID=UPI0025F94F9D|nr:ATP-binding protein [uncultured Thiodictyon sp.]